MISVLMGVLVFSKSLMFVIERHRNTFDKATRLLICHGLGRGGGLIIKESNLIDAS